MVEAELSSKALVKLAVSDLATDLSIESTDSITTVVVSPRETTRLTVPGTGVVRIYDSFVGSVDGVGTLQVGFDGITVEHTDDSQDTIIENIVSPRRTVVKSFQAIPVEIRNNTIEYDLWLTTTGALAGIGNVNLLIRTFTHTFEVPIVKQVLAEISNNASLVSFDVVQRQIPNENHIVYDLFIFYIPV